MTVLVKILLTVVLLDPRSLDTFTLPKSVAAHAASLVLAALLIWLVARYGLAIMVWSPTYVGAGALLLSFAAAALFAVDPTIALFGVFRRYLGLTQMLDNVLLFLGVTMLFRDARSLRLLGGVSIGVSVPVLLYALVQRLGLDPLKFTQSTQIPISTLGNPDLVGGFVSVIGITALGLALLIRGPRLTRGRVALVLIGIPSLGVLYLTGTRAGVLGIGAGWLAVIALAFLMPNVEPRRRRTALAIPVVLALAVVVSPLGARLGPSFVRGDLAISSRFEIWSAAERAVAERPILGLGPDNFAATYPSHRALESNITTELENSTHDLWLYVATSSGLVGVAAMLLFVALLLVQGLRLARRGNAAALALVPFAAYLGMSLVTVNEIVLDWMFWTSAGVIAGGSARPVAATVAHRRGPARSWNALGASALAVAAAFSAFVLVPRIGAGEAMLASEGLSGANRAAEALPYGEAGVVADPRRAEAWSTYGTALYKAGETAAAINAYNVAAQLQPWHPLSWMNLAISWSTIGNQGAAYEAARRAVATDPYNGDAHDFVSQLAYLRGDYSTAAAEGKKALEYGLDQRESTYFTTVSAYVQLKDLEDAEPLARQGVAQHHSARLRLQLAAILADRSMKAEAVAVLDDLLRDDPTNANARALWQALTGQAHP